MTAAVVEFDPLPDAVRTAAENDHLLLRRRVRFADLFKRSVHIRREGLELRGAGINPLVSRHDAIVETTLPHGGLIDAVYPGAVFVTEPVALPRAQQIPAHLQIARAH